MKQVAIWLAVLLCLAAVSLSAGELREIELKDGSVITGEVLSLKNGVYILKSESLGEIRIEEAKIRAIRSKSPVSPSLSQTGAASGGTRSLQEKMMSDQEIMGLIQSLQSDPDFKKTRKS